MTLKKKTDLKCISPFLPDLNYFHIFVDGPILYCLSQALRPLNSQDMKKF